MSTISNRFYITSLEDGVTLHGNLESDRSLSQGWNKNVAVPDWTVAANQPTVYLTLLSGSTLVVPNNNFTWKYNGVAIEFSSQQSTVGGQSGYLSTDGKFFKTTKSVTYGASTQNMPALRIVANLAASDNADVDTIAFEGSYSLGGSPVNFVCSTQVRISSFKDGSYFGVVEFVNGTKVITAPGQTITMYGVLYDATGSPVSGISTQWSLNGGSATAGQTISGHTNAYQVSEGSVTDHATVRCDFVKDGNVVYTEFVYVDDMQDPEFLYIQYNGANGNAASLRKGETATFQMWVGTRDDPSVLGGTGSPTYNTIKVKLYDSLGVEITASGLATNIPDRGADGYRNLPMSGGKATIAVHDDTSRAYGKNMFGIVYASTGSGS